MLLCCCARTAGISSTTAKQHKSWLAWIRCRLYIRFAVNYSLTHHQKQKNWVAIGPLEKPHPLVLNKAERQWSLTAASSRVGKVVDSVLQTSVGRPQNDDIELLKKRPLMDYVFFPPARAFGISSTTAKQHKSWLAWIPCRLYIRFAVNYSSPSIRSKTCG